MNRVRTEIHFPQSHRSVIRAFRTGVSLHSHTEFSQEELSGLPRHLERMPVVSHFLRRELERYSVINGRAVDFTQAYWRGPLGARSAHDLERKQIEQLDLPAIVSLTDHDNIDAGLQLQTENIIGDVPVSVEWTVPFENTYFHIGVHNMEPLQARSIMTRMAAFTRNSNAKALRGIPGGSRSGSQRADRVQSSTLGHGKHWPRRYAGNRNSIFDDVWAAHSRIGNQWLAQLAREYGGYTARQGVQSTGCFGRRPPRSGAECHDQPDTSGKFRAICAGDSRRTYQRYRNVAPIWRTPMPPPSTDRLGRGA